MQHIWISEHTISLPNVEHTNVFIDKCKWFGNHLLRAQLWDWEYSCVTDILAWRGKDKYQDVRLTPVLKKTCVKTSSSMSFPHKRAFYYICLNKHAFLLKSADELPL